MGMIFMKIIDGAFLENVVGSKYNTAVSEMSKSLMQMKSGDKFEGTVVDIKQNSVSLMLGDNNVINAKALVNPDLRIGEKASFIVKENNAGQIFVEISKTEESNVNFIRELLNNADMPASKENIDLVKFLIDNNMPVDKKTISDAFYFKYANEAAEKMNESAGLTLDKSLSKGENVQNNVLEKVLFLLKEEIPAGKVSVDTLNRLLDSSTSLKAEFSSIASEISKMPEGELKNKLLELFDIDKNDVKDIQKAIAKKLFFNDNDVESHKSLSDKFEKTYEISSKGSEIVSKASEELQNSSIKQSFENIKNDLTFMKEIDNYKEYIQIPVNINGRESDCQLHIFKNSKGNKNFSKRASVLLSLDYFFVGKIDAFIEKTDRNLDFQFKCEKKDTINLIKKNINQLSDLLGNYGFRISSVSYKEKDESFNVIKNKNNQNNGSASNRRYSFDMRV